MNYLQKVLSIYEKSKHIFTENYQQVLHSPSSIFGGMFWGYHQTAQFHGPIWIYIYSDHTVRLAKQPRLAFPWHSPPVSSLLLHSMTDLQTPQSVLQCFDQQKPWFKRMDGEWLPLTSFLRTAPRQVPQDGGTFNREGCVLDLRAELRASSVFYMPFSLGGETTVWLPALSPMAPSYPTDIFAFH